jgi:hypothetical protein
VETANYGMVASSGRGETKTGAITWGWFDLKDFGRVRKPAENGVALARIGIRKAALAAPWRVPKDANPLRTGRSTSRHGRVRRGEKGHLVEKEGGGGNKLSCGAHLFEREKSRKGTALK